jgi:excisionase family DNA binding protein
MAITPPRDAVDLLTKPFYAPSEVAQLASLSNSTILNYIHDGRLAAVKLSERTYRIPRKAVIRLLERTDATVEL